MTGVDHAPSWQLERREAEKLIGCASVDPFALLGPHETEDGYVIRAILPGAKAVDVVAQADGRLLASMARGAVDGLFEAHIKKRTAYKLRISRPDAEQETEDPYAFGPLLGEIDIYLFNEGRHFALADVFGAQFMVVDGVPGVRFAVWAPNARRVAVVGDFNTWDPQRHPMRARYPSGIWELFIPRAPVGTRYKFDIVGPGGERFQKADPVARRAELPPATASVVAEPEMHAFKDADWMSARAACQAVDAPLSIYEVHLGSWLKSDAGAFANWDSAISHLIPYVAEMGFTHIELLPIAEHPFGGSWGYQTLGLFAPTSRYGTPQDFARFIDAAHNAGLGVILDWVPAHFPTDPHGLARFDGTALYEHLDPREGFHRDWNTFIYNFGRREVQGFLIASALFWLEKFHVDGLRVDAVASMLYRDYSREAGEWVPNVYGGRENIEAIDFLRHLNSVVTERCPGAMMIAEESTAWPGVTKPVEKGGLGFAYKWNMGWMHDTLRYMARDPIHRSYHHDDITFGLLYAFSENFILPLSHDEVVHGKRSLIAKMPGDAWQRFANLRVYLSFMWAHPGKKLLFMGGELAQEHEWSHDGEVEWFRLNDQPNAGIQRLVRDLNRLYKAEDALHRRDCEPEGFRWIIGDDRGNSVFAFLRLGRPGSAPILVVCNMSPVPRPNYRIGVPVGGIWREIFNSDAEIYGGSNVGNAGEVRAIPQPLHGEAQTLNIILPPLAAVMFKSAS
ncbi:1,4-alpha-glucan branching protein GlgB [uncultured Methylovirgula sp.]|uniref:1,4-alpha-glucan branching protein GlgB n=1 Tax=uncultured Methylovirgula sp. TaxID=1285960 RepID=UPI00263701E1|nr:1,4-alpha-glucan branching protein GlgB [uncultured Methylovirgula sp.]